MWEISTKLLLLFCSLVIIGIWLVWKYKWEIIVVRGRSMWPTLQDGDYVLIDKRPKHYAVDDLCVYTPPDGSYLVVKRIHVSRYKYMDTSYYCKGDNRQFSRDSRHYGWIPEKDIEGRVIKQWRKRRRK